MFLQGEGGADGNSGAVGVSGELAVCGVVSEGVPEVA